MGYYSTIKRNEVLMHAATCMNLETCYVEISQTQKATSCRVLFIRTVSRKGASIENWSMN